MTTWRVMLMRCGLFGLVSSVVFAYFNYFGLVWREINSWTKFGYFVQFFVQKLKGSFNAICSRYSKANIWYATFLWNLQTGHTLLFVLCILSICIWASICNALTCNKEFMGSFRTFCAQIGRLRTHSIVQMIKKWLILSRFFAKS